MPRNCNFLGIFFLTFAYWVNGLKKKSHNLVNLANHAIFLLRFATFVNYEHFKAMIGIQLVIKINWT